MKQLRWVAGAAGLGAAVFVIVVYPRPFLFAVDLPYAPLLGRAIYVLLLASAMCVYRVLRGPTGADRLVAIDILGILIVGFCAVLSVSTGRSWYMDIGIAWALQSFIGALALSKHLEGRAFDD